MSSSYRQSLELFLSQLDVKADSCLDIGGSQLPIKNRVRSWDVEQYTIADLPSPHEGQKPDLELDINKDLHDEVSTWGLIFCLEVFEYVYDPINAMRLISNCLENGGTAWVTFPSFYPMHNPVEDDCLRYMPAGIKKLADATGLKIKQMIPRRPDTNALQQFFYAERLRAAKHQDHNFMGWIVEFEK